MLRVTIELLPGGNEDRARTLGMIEIANDGTGTQQTGNYVAVLKKTAPFSGALKAKWRGAVMYPNAEDEEVMTGQVSGFDRNRRGVYDLLYRALTACGIGKRNQG